MKYKDTIFAIDFDGTCVTHEYPKVGRFVGAQKVLSRLVDEGAKLILWTMRSDGRVEQEVANPLTDAVNWFKDNNIPLFGINENPEQKSWTGSPKAYAHIYIDDAALGIPLVKGLNGERPYVDWDKIEELLFGDKQ
jgi:hypothetical protein